jgi:hypothetical protein
VAKQISPKNMTIRNKNLPTQMHLFCIRIILRNGKHGAVLKTILRSSPFIRDIYICNVFVLQQEDRDE